MKAILSLVVLFFSPELYAGSAFSCGTRDRSQAYFAHSPKVASARGQALAKCRTESPEPNLCIQPLCARYSWKDEPTVHAPVYRYHPPTRSEQEAMAGAVAAAHSAEEQIRQDKLERIIREYDERRR